MTLHTDPALTQYDGVTNIYVRAQNPDGKCVSTDIATLTDESLKEWLTTLNPHRVVISLLDIIRADHQPY